jgi:hypothetical protein
MTTDPLPSADQADVAEQEQELAPPEEDSPDADSEDLATEASEADVLEQQTDVPGWDDDEEG